VSWANCPAVDIVVHADEADLNMFDLSGDGASLAESDRRVRGNMVAISGWASAAPPAGARRLTMRFWLRPVSVLGTGRVSGLTAERTSIDAAGQLAGTGEFETLDVQMVLRSVGYQSVPLPDVPFDSRACVVPNSAGRCWARWGAASWRVRGGLAQARPDRGDRDQQVRRGRDRQGAASKTWCRAQTPRRCRGRACCSIPLLPLPGRVAAGGGARGPRGRAGLLRGVAAHRGRGRRPGEGAGPGRAGQAARPGRDLGRLPAV